MKLISEFLTEFEKVRYFACPIIPTARFVVGEYLDTEEMMFITFYHDGARRASFVAVMLMKKKQPQITSDYEDYEVKRLLKCSDDPLKTYQRVLKFLKG
jgi:hypothetical protein